MPPSWNIFVAEYMGRQVTDGGNTFCVLLFLRDLKGCLFGGPVRATRGPPTTFQVPRAQPRLRIQGVDFGIRGRHVPDLRHLRARRIVRQPHGCVPCIDVLPPRTAFNDTDHASRAEHTARQRPSCRLSGRRVRESRICRAVCPPAQTHSGRASDCSSRSSRAVSRSRRRCGS